MNSDDGPGDDGGPERHSLADLVELLERERPLSPPSDAEPDPDLWVDPELEAATDPPHDDREPPDDDAESAQADALEADSADARSDPSEGPDPTAVPSDRSRDGRPSLGDLADRVSRLGGTAGRDGSESADASAGASRTERAERSEGSDRVDADFSAPSRGLGRETVRDLVGESPNVLLVGPESCTADQHLCTQFLAPAASEGDEVNLLLVTYGQSAAERAEAVAGDLAGLPERTAIVSLGGSDRARTTVSAPGSETTIPVKSVPNQGDLMKLGFAITKYLSEWESSSARTLVCFHSLTDALQAASDPRLVLRFLHVLQHQIEAADARAHFHLDPDAHPSQLILTFTSLFDTVLRFDRDGSVSLDQ
ncbi:DUF7504 family protein [Halobellus rubicundus]|uniref:KaiC-like domain-containing protein n=1 Tax=Halobellus rubicundus TaxID=2996466 RepID=A0ABD5MB22_9EURY